MLWYSGINCWKLYTHNAQITVQHICQGVAKLNRSYILFSFYVIDYELSTSLHELAPCQCIL